MSDIWYYPEPVPALEDIPTPKEGDRFVFTGSDGKKWQGVFGPGLPRTDLDPEGTRYTIPMRYEEQG